MNLRNTLITVALIGGLISGPWTLQTASLSQLPIQWSDLLFVFFGCAFATFFVLGLQVLFRNVRGLQNGWRFFAIISIYLLGSGISAAIIGVINNNTLPYVFLFLVIGVGITMGVLLCRILFASKLTNT